MQLANPYSGPHALLSTLISATVLMIGLVQPATLSGAPAAQDVRSTLFREADQMLESAKQAQANLLAPKTFEEAMRHYRRAEEDFEKQGDLNQIRRRLRQAAELFRQAEEATELARVTFTAVLAAREDAENAEAMSAAASQWTDAEKKFNEAARKLEEGDINGARKRATEAEDLFRTSELAAIKANYLSETLQILAEAERLDVKDHAPKTLRAAQDLVRQAEGKLTEDRYDTDEPRNLAQEAKRQARYAIYLTSQIRSLKEAKGTTEDLLLAGEQPLRRIAGAAEVTVSFEQGPEPPTEAIVQRISAYQDTIQILRSRLSGREEMVTALEARVSELQDRLGGIEEERSALAERLAALARLQQRFTTVERLFLPEEARVIREGDDVIIRLLGLSFPVGGSAIDRKYFPLLTKVQQAIRTFPNSKVEIEGHTDSFGSDAANSRLSQERADAVRSYLLSNPDFNPRNFTAVGHGETRPVASNDTAEGRAKNRRIDIIIHPDVGAIY